jgi:hypothetical protein
MLLKDHFMLQNNDSLSRDNGIMLRNGYFKSHNDDSLSRDSGIMPRNGEIMFRNDHSLSRDSGIKTHNGNPMSRTSEIMLRKAILGNVTVSSSYKKIIHKRYIFHLTLAKTFIILHNTNEC